MNDTFDNAVGLIEFVKAKLVQAEKDLRSREDMERAWRDGSEKAWQYVGCRLTRAQRIAQAERDARIAARKREDVRMFKMLLEMIEK